MDSALAVHRLHFAFTVTFHYLFPQLTMGLALLIFVLRTVALRRNDEHYRIAARFWTRIFAINFAIGVVTGIPMEFQFGANWAGFARAAGGVIGQTLAMEGVFSFFLESTFLGLLVYGEKYLSPRLHWFSSLMVFLGSWLSGFFIIVEKQYGFGDLVTLTVVSATEASGTVENVTLRVTRLRSPNGEVMTIPNGQIVKAVNESKDWARAVVDIPVSTSVDLSRVSEVLLCKRDYDELLRLKSLVERAMVGGA